ncbi:response regulator [Ideonella sp. DXS29W]|uniref:Response regulator n=1 Tax=Ideonella lacteola TaxID=2984193 RepID=A0ABU9BXV8_9BURK
MTSLQDGDHVTTVEVARQLGLAVRSVQLMVDRGELEAWRTAGGHRRISRASVDRWVERHRSQGAAPAPLAAPTEARASRAAVPPPEWTQPSVLLIEDSIHYQNLVSMLVRKHFPDVQLYVAGDGIAGLAMVGELRPDVLLVDILLPGIDGAALITSLRSHPQFRHSKLIVVTSLDEADRAPYAFALEGVPLVHKPRLVAELPAKLADALPRSAPPPSAADTVTGP